MEIVRHLRQWFSNLNFFFDLKKAELTAEQLLRHQLLITRLYLILLSATLISLILFMSLILKTNTETVVRPTQIMFEQLQTTYRDTLSCPCERIAVPYSNFLSINPTYHQICSSDFISFEWIRSLFNAETPQMTPLDFRLTAAAQFRLLGTMCSLMEATMEGLKEVFLTKEIVTKNTLSFVSLNKEADALIDKFQVFRDMSLVPDAASQVTIKFILTSRHHPALNFNSYQQMAPSSTLYQQQDTCYPIRDDIVDNADLYSDFEFCNPFSTMTYKAGIYNWSAEDKDASSRTVPIPPAVYIVPGMHVGCTPYYALIPSTLQCFFDSMCINTTTQWISDLLVSQWPKPLNRSLLSKYLVNSTIETIYNEMMTDNWEIRKNFSGYYATCAPIECTYTYVTRSNYLYVLITLIGLFGGLTVVLRIVSPLIITQCHRIHKLYTDIRQWLNHSKHMHQKKTTDFGLDSSSIPKAKIETPSCHARINGLITYFKTQLLSINLFEDTLTNPLHGIRATRVYVILLLINIAILIFYTSLAEKLILKLCLVNEFQVRTKRGGFMIISLGSMTMMLSGTESEIRYQSFQVNNNWLLRRYSPAPAAFNECACSVAYDCPDPVWSSGQFICNYGNNCTAGTVIWSIPGLVKSCTFFETMLSSDLRCFFNQTCVNITLSMYNVDMPMRKPLPANTLAMKALDSSIRSPFLPNDKMRTLLEEMMIIDWNFSVNYSGYYTACAPANCVYRLTERFNIIYVITTILGLFGGLNISLKILILVVVRLIIWTKKIRGEQQVMEHRVAPTYHQICSSDFIEEKWTTTLYGYGPQANSYSQLDRPLLSKQHQILKKLCSEAKLIVADAIFDFYKSLLITASALSRASFQMQISAIIQNFIAQTPITFRRLLAFITEMVASLLIPTAFNNDWLPEYGNSSNSYTIRNKPRTFSNSTCNCVISRTCQEPLRIGPPDLVIPGLVVGCYPIDGLRMSTLECFYSSTCISSIINFFDYYTEINGSLPVNFVPPSIPVINVNPLSSSIPSRFSITNPITYLIDDLFIEYWSKTSVYENYYAACAPSLCQYQYVRRNDLVYVITSILSLYGGVTIGLRFIIWKTLYIYKKFKANHVTVQPFVINMNTA
ncbi:hypothetical protein I4U23_016340 [Adineta vaga]|nr:hypothetical protein I4U23_016340 [Adineta vaga]